MAHPVMWFEVLGRDGDSLQRFYGSLFGWTLAADNPLKYGIVDTGEPRGIPGGVGSVYDGTQAREGILGHCKLHLHYRAEDGRTSERTVRPLGVFFWGRAWTLAAWCELRADFRNFRIDRVEQSAVTEPFADEPGKTLADLLTRYGPDAVRLLDG